MNPNLPLIDYMVGKSALATTHKIIVQMVKEGKVIERKDEKNSQVHHLFINDKKSVQFVIGKDQ